MLAGLLSLLGCKKRPEIEIVLAGNSIPANLFGLPFEQTLAEAIGPRYVIMANIAVSGLSTTDMLGRDHALIKKSLAWRPSKLVFGTRPAVLVAWEGTNELLAMSRAGLNQGLKAFENTRTYFQHEKTAHPGLRTVTATVLPRTDSEITQPTFEQQRLIYNGLLREAVTKKEPWLDELADVASDSTLTVPGPKADGTESEMYYDYVHLSKTGLKVAISYFKPAIERAAKLL